jgi:pSer/pThr/pTyr-binding forkhead associated (FHA) protein
MLRFIRIKQEKDAEYICKLLNAPMRIGRSSDADIVLNDSSVSRIHITLIPLGGGDYGLRDEGSTNGTRVNGQAVNSYQIYPLQLGDTIHSGKTVLTFDIQE